MNRGMGYQLGSKFVLKTKVQRIITDIALTIDKHPFALGVFTDYAVQIFMLARHPPETTHHPLENSQIPT